MKTVSGWLARLRVGTRVVLLLLIPMTALLVVTGVANWNGVSRARQLEQFQRRADASVDVAAIAEAVARERSSAIRTSLLAESELATTGRHARVDHLIASLSRTAIEGGDPEDLRGRLSAVGRQLFALRLRVPAMSAANIQQDYGQVIETLESIQRDLTAQPPTRDVATAAFADLAMRSAIEAARREQLDIWELLEANDRPTQRAAFSARWAALEQAWLNAYRTAAPSSDTAELNAALFSPPGLYVRQTRDRVSRGEPTSAPGAAAQWWTRSGERLSMLQQIRGQSRRAVQGSVEAGLTAAWSGVWAMLALSATVVVAVLGLGLLLRRSIAGSLQRLSRSARALADGDLSVGIDTDGRDEIAAVGQALAAVRTMNRQIVHEIHAVTDAIAAKTLSHSADAGAFHGAWADVLEGMNATMTEVGRLHGSAQREVERQKAFGAVGRSVVGGLEINQAYHQCCQLLIDHVGALRAEIYDRDQDGWKRRMIAGASAPPWPATHSFDLSGLQPTCRPDAAIAVVRSVAETHGEAAAALIAEFSDPDALDAADVLYVDGVVRLLDEASHRRKQEESQLRTQKLEATGTMAAAIAHDFNNVLGAILNNARLGELETKDEQAAETFTAISGAVGRASEIVDRLLSFSRTEPPDQRQFDLADLLAEVCTLLRPGLPRNIELIYAGHPPMEITGDATRIHQVIVNLITNSAHAIGSDVPGQITVTLDFLVLAEPSADAEALPAGTYARVRIHDTGPGIPDSVATRIFDPFFTTKPKGQGTGLGLAAALTIARDHHGSLTLESIPNRGTTATLCLPAPTY